MIIVRANARNATYISDDLITSGSVGIPVTFNLSEDFDGLSCIAVFEGSGAKIDVALMNSNTCVVPHEVLAQAGGYLRIGVYASNGEGTIVIPTVWARSRLILSGTTPSEVDPYAPTPGWVAQVQEAAAEALANSEEAIEIAGGADAAAADARQSASAAATSATAAEQSASAAGDSQAAAEAASGAAASARDASVAAQSGAESSAQAAAGSATAAAGSAAAAAASEAAAREVEESIPEDYADLSADVVDLKSAFNDFTEQIATETHSDNIVDDRNIINVSIDGTGGYTFDTTRNGMRVPVTVGKRYGIFRINSSNAVIAYKPRIVICDSTGNVLRFINATDNDFTVSETGASYILMSGSIALADWQKVMVIEDYEGTAPTSYIAKSTTYAITGIPDKTSDLVNDSGYVTENDISTVEKSRNVLNPKNIIQAYIDGAGNLIYDGVSVAISVDVSGDTRYGLFRNNSQGTVIAFSPRIRIEDAAGNLLSYYKNTTNDFTTPSNATKMYIWNSGYTAETYTTAQAIEGYDGTAPTSYSPYYKFLIINGKSQSWWKGKNAVIYGDSITAQGNANNATGYFREAEFIHQFEDVYYRGVGGQTFKLNPYTFYANADGSYNSRDSGGNPPAGTTEHLGYFASWDRITAMIPEAIRNSIDLVVVCGGTNDFKNVEDTSADGDNSAIVPAWIVNNTQDQIWANSSYYMGGDYDLSTLAGAIASTLMKMQIWCPNAIIILATPFPRYELTDHAQMVVNNVNFRQFCETEIEIAQYMSAPVIDANGECNITLYNYGECTLADNVHPTQLGRDYYGKPFVGELYRIFPKSY